ncbi:MAG: hypothetical protein KJO50_01310 [Bacteroidia bacterium]|nr:hypothetical protein [Bacteroidia bacterium]
MKGLSHKTFPGFVVGLGLVIYLVLLVLSICYFTERIGTLDNAFQTFLLITENNITIMADRWPAVIIRIVPWILTTIGAPLIIIMIGFSISYILFQLTIFLLLAITLREPVLAVLQILVLLLACSDGFYWCNSEQIQGISIVILSFGFLRQSDLKINFKNIILMVFLFFALLYYHPILVFPIGYLFCYSTIEKLKPDLRMLGFALVFVIAWYIKNQFFSNWYDIMKSDEFADNLGLYVFNFWTLESISQFFGETWTKYHFIIPGGIVCIFVQLAQKKFLSAWYTLFIASLYFFIVIIATPTIEYSFYTESNFYILILFFYYPILKHLNDHTLNSSTFKITVTAILLISIGRIISYSGNYQKRLDWISSTMEENQCNKIIVTEDLLDHEIRFQIWSLPYESLILGHQKGMNKSIHPLVNSFEDDYNENLFVTSFKTHEPGEINSAYFQFPEGPYCTLGEHR